MQTRALPTAPAIMLTVINETMKIARPVGSRVGRALLTVEKLALKLDELFMIKF